MYEAAGEPFLADSQYLWKYSPLGEWHHDIPLHSIDGIIKTSDRVNKQDLLFHLLK